MTPWVVFRVTALELCQEFDSQRFTQAGRWVFGVRLQLHRIRTLWSVPGGESPAGCFKKKRQCFRHWVCFGWGYRFKDPGIEAQGAFAMHLRSSAASFALSRVPSAAPAAAAAAPAAACNFLRLLLPLLVLRLLLLLLRLRWRAPTLAFHGDTLGNTSSKPDRCRLTFSGMPLASKGFFTCAGSGVMAFGHSLARFSAYRN